MSNYGKRAQKYAPPGPMLTLSEEAGLGEPAPPPAAIVITVPSSPDEPSTACPRVLRTPPIKALDLRTPSDSTPAPRAPFYQETLSPQPQDESMSPYQERLAAAHLPPPGPEYFTARRALWLAPASNPSFPTEANSSRRRLEALLEAPDALEDEVVWRAGVDRVWHGLLNGARLKHRLPLALVLKILQAGWIREGTWPRGAIVPDSDDAPEAPLPETTESPASTTPNVPTPGPDDVHSRLSI